MPTLTLPLDDDPLAQAEAYARRTGPKLSALVAHLVQPAAGRALLNPGGCLSPPPAYDY